MTSACKKLPFPPVDKKTDPTEGNTLSLWKRDRDSDLEQQLRAGRPEPKPELTEQIADRVRPRRSGFVRGLNRVPLGVAGVFSAGVLVAVIALGGAGSSLNAAGDALDLQNAAKNGSVGAAAVDEYGPRVNICINGQATLRVQSSLAVKLIADGIAVAGKCPFKPDKIRGDKDADGTPDKQDNCPKDWNPLQANQDGDKRGDSCDRFPLDPNRK